MAETNDSPAWESPEVFPEKIAESPYGVRSRKGKTTGFDSLDALDAHVRSSRESVEAVWTPDTDRMVPPEAVPELLEPLRHRFVDVAEDAAVDARRHSMLFGFFLLWALYASLDGGTPPQESVVVGLAALLLIVMGLMPWYEAIRERKSAWELTVDGLASEEEEARFEKWLSGERHLFTSYLLLTLVVVGLAQIWVGLEKSVEAAGLLKDRYRAGEGLRLFTAPFLHGHPLHWALNAGGLCFLGRRVEALARWPHLVLVYFAAMVAGGLATVEFMPDRPSVGASGGLMGLLGFLLVFETLHPRLVPQPTRQRLFVTLLLTFVVGFVGYNFIDNYAHAGGLVAGVIYAAVVFPKSRSARRPRANQLDLIFGALVTFVLTVSALVAASLMLGS